MRHTVDSLWLFTLPKSNELLKKVFPDSSVVVVSIDSLPLLIDAEFGDTNPSWWSEIMFNRLSLTFSASADKLFLDWLISQLLSAWWWWWWWWWWLCMSYDQKNHCKISVCSAFVASRAQILAYLTMNSARKSFTSFLGIPSCQFLYIRYLVFSRLEVHIPLISVNHPYIKCLYSLALE